MRCDETERVTYIQYPRTKSIPIAPSQLVVDFHRERRESGDEIFFMC